MMRMSVPSWCFSEDSGPRPAAIWIYGSDPPGRGCRIAMMQPISTYPARDFPKRALQACVLLGSMVPILAGFAGVLRGPALLSAGIAMVPELDSHFRYLSGLLFAIGVAYLSTVPDIEGQGRRFRLLTALVFTGGIARLVGTVLDGYLSTTVGLSLAMELLVAPGLMLWQMLLARRGSGGFVGAQRLQAADRL
jgi:hypothetical protein